MLDQHPSVVSSSLYTAEQCREIDRLAIEENGIAGIHLMKAAGRAVFEQLMLLWGSELKTKGRQLTVCCGVGNNAGDGYVIAGLAKQSLLNVEVWQVGGSRPLKGDAKLAWQFAEDAGVVAKPIQADSVIPSGVIVDALLGTGIQGEVREEYSKAIQLINNSQNRVLAVDLPSGLCANKGSLLGSAVKADATITFIGLKRGLLTGMGPEFVGKLYFDDLDIPANIYQKVVAASHVVQLDQYKNVLSPRSAVAHKGEFGHVLIMGGDHGMAGAVAMVSEAAARVGAGLVSVATRLENVAAIVARRPEVMARGVESQTQIQAMLERASVVVLGPGLGQSEWSRSLFLSALNSSLPIVVDADALNLMAKEGVNPRDNWLLTPHPGEAARLLRCTTEVVSADRFAAAENLVSQFGGVCILKGAGSIIAGKEESAKTGFAVAAVGNPGMASGGMGDVLSGVLGGLVAQGVSLRQAAEFGVCLHGAAADRATEHAGQRGLLATDLMPHLRRLVNGL